jgi:integrase/recombinase XerD
VSLGKQAKPLTKGQIEVVASYLAKTRHPTRNRLIFMLDPGRTSRPRDSFLNVEHGHRCRAQDRSDHRATQDEVSKGQSGWIIPLHSKLRAALIELHEIQQPTSKSRVICTERSKQTSPQASTISFDGCSSHSGRRTFITNAARKISLVGDHRDVQMLAGHTSLRVTQQYDADQDAQ